MDVLRLKKEKLNLKKLKTKVQIEIGNYKY